MSKKIALNIGLNENTWAKDFRKNYLSPLRRHLDVVERKMCADEWDEIKYEGVPSKAMKLYKDAFENHDDGTFSQYLEDVKSGDKKINSSVLMPHELVETYCCGGSFNPASTICNRVSYLFAAIRLATALRMASEEEVVTTVPKA